MSIRLNGVNKSFGEPPVHVLRDITLAVEDGEYISITGKSGSGKSTLLYIMSSLDPATSGVVEIAGHDIQAFSTQDLHEFRNRNMGFVFQFHYLLPELTALENVLMPARKFNELEQRTPYAMSLFREFGLEDKVHRKPGQLSGGEQQRVAIARALVMEPKFIFADEPTGNLDSVSGAAVMSLLERVNQEKKTTVIFVTHDPDFAKNACRFIQLADGRVVADERKHL